MKKLILFLMLFSFSYTSYDIGDDNLKIAAFNIQILGKAKISKPEVVDAIVKILSRYDIIFVQEYREKSGKSIYKLLDKLNEYSNDKYSIKISKRLGSTKVKEQYVYFYKNIPELEVLSDYQFNDRMYQFERAPYSLKVKYKNNVFALIGIHVDPDRVYAELESLNDIVPILKMKLRVRDVIILGDLNAACSYLSRNTNFSLNLKRNSEYKWLIRDVNDTTVGFGNCAYDRIIVTRRLAHHVSYSNVFKYEEQFNYSKFFAYKISDHYPVEVYLNFKKN